MGQMEPLRAQFTCKHSQAAGEATVRWTGRQHAAASADVACRHRAKQQPSILLPPAKPLVLHARLVWQAINACHRSTPACTHQLVHLRHHILQIAGEGLRQRLRHSRTLANMSVQQPAALLQHGASQFARSPAPCLPRAQPPWCQASFCSRPPAAEAGSGTVSSLCQPQNTRISFNCTRWQKVTGVGAGIALVPPPRALRPGAAAAPASAALPVNPASAAAIVAAVQHRIPKLARLRAPKAPRRSTHRLLTVLGGWVPQEAPG